VEADRGALEQILSNLVENEVKYASGKSTVTIATAVEDEQFVITISDSGPGIAEVHLSRLFERFYRVDAGRSRELGGTGLGLAIVKHLLEAHAGSISVESEEGKGTTFRLVLPRNRALLLERPLESVPLESPIPEGVDAARLSQPELL
jgi:two-component system phosphate regulon sensor histidine kinase PhoR